MIYTVKNQRDEYPAEDGYSVILPHSKDIILKMSIPTMLDIRLNMVSLELRRSNEYPS